MAARCEAAGRPNNEDNYQLSDDLSNNNWGFTTDKEVVLGNKGALLAIADGMGGMNAGEVASALAIETIKEWFSSEKLTDEVMSSSDSIKKYIEKAIMAADSRIREDARTNQEKKGMGTTIVLALIIREKIFVGWCGDSRAYRFNPQEGLTQLSHDHSYVQELVDAGKLNEKFAFDHPDSNIITRSLGDPNVKAKPEVADYLLRNNDIILLCSDGLSGVLRDHEIEEILRDNSTSTGACRDALWQASLEAGWNDNVTIGLYQTLSGCRYNAEQKKAINNNNQKKKSKKRTVSLIIVFIVILGTLGGFYLWNQSENECLVSLINDLKTKLDKEKHEAIYNTLDSLSNELHIINFYNKKIELEIKNLEKQINAPLMDDKVKEKSDTLNAVIKKIPEKVSSQNKGGTVVNDKNNSTRDTQNVMTEIKDSIPNQ